MRVEENDMESPVEENIVVAKGLQAEGTVGYRFDGDDLFYTFSLYLFFFLPFGSPTKIVLVQEHTPAGETSYRALDRVETTERLVKWYPSR
ncbi:hypothetical protein JTB14_000391 [Gonioctena quinquepunctata]|nr:hypothetical protein JTB14_000391 [Gonioctena quinquepunctata]